MMGVGDTTLPEIQIMAGDINLQCVAPLINDKLCTVDGNKRMSFCSLLAVLWRKQFKYEDFDLVKQMQDIKITKDHLSTPTLI